MTAAQRAAFVLFGDLPKLGPYLAELTTRDLRALVVAPVPTTPAEQRAVQFMREQGHPLCGVDDAAFALASDLPTIVDRVRSWAGRYAIEGVFSAAETFVEAAAAVADLLGVPSPGLRAAAVCRNKYLQRVYLEEWSPTFHLVTQTSAQAASSRWSIPYPVVVKPLRLYSSIGVRVLSDADGLMTHLGTVAAGDGVLVEERIDGDEISVEAIVHDGRVAFESITAKITNETVSDCFVEMSHTVPCSSLPESVRRDVLSVNRAVLERLDFRSGIAHAEYRVTGHGRVALMEVAARPPGDGILHLYHLSTGQPVEAALVAVALGDSVTYPRPVRRARQIYLDHERGRLRDVVVSGSDVRPTWVVDTGIWPEMRPGRPVDPAGVRAIVVLKDRGHVLAPIRESSDRAVTVLFDAPSAAELDALEARVRAAITIEHDVTV